MFCIVIFADLRKGICQYQFNPLPGLTQIGSDEIRG